MKKLYLIGGTMGVGKTAVSQKLKMLLPECVFLDGDWCWDAHPFVVNDETKAMVTDNICHLLRGFLRCGVYKNVVFCWVMHEQNIIDEILSRLDTNGVQVICVSLVCGEKELRKRLSRDIENGLRKADIIERSISRLSLYEKLNTIKLDVSDIGADEAARIIAEL